MENKALSALCDIVNISSDRIISFRMGLHNSISSQLESSSGTIFFFMDIITKDKYVVKVKSFSYCKKLERIINQGKSDYEIQSFVAACILYQAKYTYLRESTIYACEESVIKQIIPMYYGYKIILDNIFIITKFVDSKIDYSLDYKTDSALFYLGKIHSHFFKNYKLLNSLGLDILSPELFEKNVDMVKHIFNKAKLVLGLNFPQQLTEELWDYILRINFEFDIMKKSGLTLCHCDFAFRNILYSDESLKIIDWELSTALEPQYDLVEFLVDYPKSLTPLLIQRIVNKYILYIDFFTNLSCFHVALLRNLYHYFCFRMSMLILINKSTVIPWLNDSISNYILLWKYLKSNIASHESVSK